jgi:DNA-binding NarL/FixJ family response regulator
MLLADDHAMVRQGLRSLFDAYDEIQVVGEAADGEEAVFLSGRLQPDVILMDMNMPRMDGIQATRRIKREQPAVIVIGLSVQSLQELEMAMKEAGATAFLNKEAAGEQLYQTIQTVRSGERAELTLGGVQFEKRRVRPSQKPRKKMAGIVTPSATSDGVRRLVFKRGESGKCSRRWVPRAAF